MWRGEATVRSDTPAHQKAGARLDEPANTCHESCTIGDQHRAAVHGHDDAHYDEKPPEREAHGDHAEDPNGGAEQDPEAVVEEKTREQVLATAARAQAADAADHRLAQLSPVARIGSSLMPTAHGHDTGGGGQTRTSRMHWQLKNLTITILQLPEHLSL